MLESYSITYVTEIKWGQGEGNFAAVTKVVQLKGAISEGRMLKSLLTCYCRKLGRNEDGGKPFTIASFSLLLPKGFDKGVVALLQVNYKAIYALDLNF